MMVLIGGRLTGVPCKPGRRSRVQHQLQALKRRKDRVVAVLKLVVSAPTMCRQLFHHSAFIYQSYDVVNGLMGLRKFSADCVYAITCCKQATISNHNGLNVVQTHHVACINGFGAIIKQMSRVSWLPIFSKGQFVFNYWYSFKSYFGFPMTYIVQ